MDENKSTYRRTFSFLSNSKVKPIESDSIELITFPFKFCRKYVYSGKKKPDKLCLVKPSKKERENKLNRKLNS